MFLLQNSFALHLTCTRLGKVIFLCTQRREPREKPVASSFAMAPEIGSCSSDIKEASGAGEPRMQEFPGPAWRAWDWILSG